MTDIDIQAIRERASGSFNATDVINSTKFMQHEIITGLVEDRADLLRVVEEAMETLKEIHSFAAWHPTDSSHARKKSAAFLNKYKLGASHD